jgi:hypothetical protein
MQKREYSAQLLEAKFLDSNEACSQNNKFIIPTSILRLALKVVLANLSAEFEILQ